MVSFRFCRYERNKDQLVIYLTNHNVVCQCGELNLELRYLIDRYSPRQVLIDFSNVAYCSREAINDLLCARRRVMSRDGEMKIRNMCTQVRTKFRNLRLDGHVFEIAGGTTNAPKRRRRSFQIDFEVGGGLLSGLL